MVCSAISGRTPGSGRTKLARVAPVAGGGSGTPDSYESVLFSLIRPRRAPLAPLPASLSPRTAILRIAFAHTIFRPGASAGKTELARVAPVAGGGSGTLRLSARKRTQVSERCETSDSSESGGPAPSPAPTAISRFVRMRPRWRRTFSQQPRVCPRARELLEIPAKRAWRANKGLRVLRSGRTGRGTKALLSPLGKGQPLPQQ